MCWSTAGRRAGVLLESGQRPETAPVPGKKAGIWLAVGDGDKSRRSAPADTERPATDLPSAARDPSTPEAALETLDRAAFQTWSAPLDWKPDLRPVRDAWLSRAHGLGEALRSPARSARPFSGAFSDLGPDGSRCDLDLDGRRPSGISRRVKSFFPIRPDGPALFFDLTLFLTRTAHAPGHRLRQYQYALRHP